MFDDILLFIKLVEIGSISKLANNLEINKSTLSKQMSRLETNLGQLLLIRHSNSFELTQYGRAVYNNFQRVEAYLQTCLQKAEQEHSNSVGNVKILCTQFMMRTLLKNSINKIYLEHSDINLELQTFTSSKDFEDSFDLAFTFVKPQNIDLLVRKLYSIPIVLMASTSLAQEVAHIKTPEELFSLYRKQIIWRSKSTQATKYIVATEIATGIKRYIEFTPQISIKNSMRSDEVFLNDFIRNVGIDENRREIASGEVQIVLPEYTFGTIYVYVVRNQGEMNSAINQVYEELLQGFKDYTQQFIATYGDLGVQFNPYIFGKLTK